MSSELQKRILSAIVLAAVVLAATWYGGIAFRLVAALMALLIWYEWSTITGSAERHAPGNLAVWAGVALVALLVVLDYPTAAGGLLMMMVLVGLGDIALFKRRDGWLIGGLLYAALSALSLAAIRGADHAGLVAMLFIFAVVWATDILAYFVGRALKGPKLAPRISPGKTWSGAIGGAVSGVIAGNLVVLLAFSRLSFWTVAIALLLSVSSQIGDLFESFIKRRFGVKDSSHLIPGHGGVMDRVDGLVFACFAAFLLTLAYAAATGHSGLSVARFLFGF